MKFHLNFLLALLALLCHLNSFSQSTNLTIDCQTPGWLSNKINYGDQMTLESLTVTGYLNNVDLIFIGELIQKSLKTIDLTDVIIAPNNILPSEMFGLEWSSRCDLNRLSLPSSIESAENDCLKYVYADTIIVGGTIHHNITEGMGWNMKKCIIREGVDSITGFSNITNLESVDLPSTLKKIGPSAFRYDNNLTNIVFPDSLKTISKLAFNGTSFNPDTLFLPDGLEDLYISAFNTPSKVYHFGRNIRFIDNLDYSVPKSWDNINGGYYYRDIICLNEIDFHIQNPNPPEVAYHSYNCFLHCTIFVPKGAKDNYMNENPWKIAGNIIEEVFVEGVSLDENKSLHVGDIIEMKAQIYPSDALTQKVQWNSSDTSVATISDDGILTAISFGITEITATTVDGGYKATCKVYVYHHTTGIEMINEVSVPKGEIYALNAHTLPLSTSDNLIIYSSDMEEIASVNEIGTIYAKAKGICTITARSIDGGFTATCIVTVTQPVEALILDKHYLSLKVGDIDRLYAEISPSSANNKQINWTSTNEQIAEINQSGSITAMKAGETWIIAVSKDNSKAKDSCLINVIQPVTGIELSQSICNLNQIGESIQLEATVFPEDATNKEIRWSSSNESICVVSQGKVIATGFGTAVVMALTLDGGYLASCTVIVEDTNAIQDITKDNQNGKTIYDLMGNKIQQTIKGHIYIQDGKKFLSK